MLQPGEEPHVWQTVRSGSLFGVPIGDCLVEFAENEMLKDLRFDKRWEERSP